MEKVYLLNKKPLLLILGYMLFMDALAIGVYLAFPDEKTAKSYLIVGPIAIIAQVSFFLLIRKRKAVVVTSNYLELKIGVKTPTKLPWASVTDVVLGKESNKDAIYISNNICREIEIPSKMIAGDVEELFADIKRGKEEYGN